MLATGESIMLGRPAKGKKARVDLPEKGTTPESGGGTATKSRAVVTAAALAPLADSQPPRRLCKREPGHPSGPTAVARARAHRLSGKPPAMTGGVLTCCFVAMDSRRNGDVRKSPCSLIRRQMPGYSGR